MACIKNRVKNKWFFPVFWPFFGPFWPLFCIGNGGQKGPKKGQNLVKNHLFLTQFFIHATSPKKVVFFAGRSIQGFQKPYYFSMNRPPQFWAGVATVSAGGMFKFARTHIYVRVAWNTPTKIFVGQQKKSEDVFLSPHICGFKNGQFFFWSDAYMG